MIVRLRHGFELTVTSVKNIVVNLSERLDWLLGGGTFVCLKCLDDPGGSSHISTSIAAVRPDRIRPVIPR
jgi:hypothetical protein